MSDKKVLRVDKLLELTKINRPPGWKTSHIIAEVFVVLLAFVLQAVSQAYALVSHDVGFDFIPLSFYGLNYIVFSLWVWIPQWNSWIIGAALLPLLGIAGSVVLLVYCIAMALLNAFGLIVGLVAYYPALGVPNVIFYLCVQGGSVVVFFIIMILAIFLIRSNQVRTRIDKVDVVENEPLVEEVEE